MSTGTRIGSQVAGYRLEQLLGRGGMSVVYLAEHISLGRKVALKLLIPPLSSDEHFRERFVRESQRAAEIDHPNIIPIYDAGEYEEQLYIAMRYVDGADLKSLITENGALGLPRSLFILDQAAAGLSAAHERNLIHRDVKPANILVEGIADRVYLTDFGIVKHTATQGLTKTGMFIGTMDYASPEQLEGLPIDLRTDVYALGCVFFECLTGRPPYDREAEVAVMHAHLTEPPPSATASRPELPKALDRVISTAMAKTKEERYASADAFANAARSAALQQPLLDTSLSERPAPAPPTVVRTDTPPDASAPAPPTAVSAPPADVSGGAPPPPPPPAPPTALTEPPHEAAPGPAPPAWPPRRSVSPWLVTGVLVLLASVASALVAYFLTRGGSEPAAGPSTKTGTTATNGTSGVANPRNLQSLIPAVLWKDCQQQSTPPSGAVASALCTRSSSSVSPSPDRWEMRTYPSDAALAAAYNAERRAHGVGKDFGRCDRTVWGGEKAWQHGPNKPGGRRFCYFDGNDAVIVWTHAKLGQDSHTDTFGIARSGNTNHDTLYAWYSFWHHQIGKLAS